MKVISGVMLNKSKLSYPYMHRFNVFTPLYVNWRKAQRDPGFRRVYMVQKRHFGFTVYGMDRFLDYDFEKLGIKRPARWP